MNYRAFDIVIDSEVPLPELAPASGEPTWRIRSAAAVEGAFDRYHTIEGPAGNPWVHFAKNSERYLLGYPEFGSFVIGPQRTIEVIANGTPEETLRHLLLDQVLPMALAHDGELILHASAVEWNGRAVAFVGATGQGKSTLAAACVGAGASLVTDDALILCGSPSAPITSVSYAGIRLWDDSRERYDAASEATYVAHYTDKRRVAVRASSASAIPVTAIFVLDVGTAHRRGAEVAQRGAEVGVTPIAARDALMLLVANTYRLDTVDPATLRREFTSIQQLVSSFPLRTLSYPRRYDALDEVVPVVRDHLFR